MINDFRIDNNSSLPVYEQIKQEIKLAILSGTLKPESQITPIRELAAAIKVNPNTIVKVYYQLSVEGFLYSKPGQGYFVKEIDKNESERKNKLFEEMTEEYINKSVKLGFTFPEIIAGITEHHKGGTNDT
ncbi:MAG: GntR family transcriptional regulator [Spirochaetales bacterium]|nr:GntR family transcriptional regulator [Spirochaetales bacterium]